MPAQGAAAYRLMLDSEHQPTGRVIMNNSLNLVGRVGIEPEVTHFESGKKLVRFTVAVREYNAKEKKIETMWINVEAWNKTADLILASVKKGREISVTGRLALNVYSKKVGDEMVPMTKPLVRLTGFHLCGANPDRVAS